MSQESDRLFEALGDALFWVRDEGAKTNPGWVPRPAYVNHRTLAIIRSTPGCRDHGHFVTDKAILKTGCHLRLFGFPIHVWEVVPNEQVLIPPADLPENSRFVEGWLHTLRERPARWERLLGADPF